MPCISLSTLLGAAIGHRDETGTVFQGAGSSAVQKSTVAGSQETATPSRDVGARGPSPLSALQLDLSHTSNSQLLRAGPLL